MFLFDLLADVLAADRVDLLLAVQLHERWQKDILGGNDALPEVLLEVFDLAGGQPAGAVLAHVVVDGSDADLAQRLLLVPALHVVLVDDRLHVHEPLLLPLLDLAGQLRR